MTDQAASAAAEVLAARAGMTADDPEPQIAARALLGLWRVQADSLRGTWTARRRPRCSTNR